MFVVDNLPGLAEGLSSTFDGRCSLCSVRGRRQCERDEHPHHRQTKEHRDDKYSGVVVNGLLADESKVHNQVPIECPETHITPLVLLFLSGD